MFRPRRLSFEKKGPKVSWVPQLITSSPYRSWPGNVNGTSSAVTLMPFRSNLCQNGSAVNQSLESRRWRILSGSHCIGKYMPCSPGDDSEQKLGQGDPESRRAEDCSRRVLPSSISRFNIVSDGDAVMNSMSAASIPTMTSLFRMTANVSDDFLGRSGIAAYHDWREASAVQISSDSTAGGR